MEIRRIYIESFKQDGDTLLLNAAASKRIINVLRLKKGNCIELFWNDNNDYLTEIIEMNHGTVQVKLKEQITRNEFCGNLRIAQSLLKSTRMDWLVEKIAEIGITKFYPIVSHYSVFSMPVQNSHRKILRWQKIMTSAAEQSYKNRIPEINEIRNFTNTLVDLKNEYDIIFFCNKSKKALDIYSLKGNNRILHGNTVLFIGPEGGWSDEEIKLAEVTGALIIAFPNVIYRSETAALAALIIMQYIKSSEEK
ncbi:MAG: hypothetical protein A2Y62_14155 [Candidatus Fischerbacteria bacterium RBG_13_37_8]|uniref:Ribosomal RNA small subunit methyltransferase E n=1 Tax=Candidatus Fischerbacteria bacterium RBG_13_37_8 TaxID=1817863 RepID=A0A1F5VFN2_9BACT|nr:MAG: hypothetical protein A2Y62_14155 [Candidatus Fischerbacteria bacterium RBG_13_37_8]